MMTRQGTFTLEHVACTRTWTAGELMVGVPWAIGRGLHYSEYATCTLLSTVLALSTACRVTASAMTESCSCVDWDMHISTTIMHLRGPCCMQVQKMCTPGTLE